MERIQQALEKAKRERDSSITMQNSATGQQRLMSQTSKGNASFSDLSYSKTKRVVISDEELKARNILAGFAHEIRAEPYRQLRSQILKKMRAEKWQTLAVTSPKPGNGKTLTALNLAVALSLEVNQTVLLVDFDLKNPSVASMLGITEVTHGIVDVMLNKVSLEDILINPGFSRLVIAPGTPQLQHTSELLSSPAMQALQHELKTRYADRLIIYDLPALLVSDDALVFSPNVDAVLLVLEDGGASEKELQQAIKLLEGSRIIGTVLNKSAI